MTKSKGINIELTSLLDVILIMLFWVLMQSNQQNGELEQQAQEEINSAQAQVQQVSEKYEQQLASTNTKLEQMSSALEGFESGSLYSLSLDFDQTSDLLSVSYNGEQLKQYDFATDMNITNSLTDIFKNVMNNQKDDAVVLVAFVYDGSVVLYRDVQAVRSAIDNLQNEYENIYITYINTSV